MITKAGVPSNIIAPGVSSYGRSFEMSSAGCWTEECTFVGPLSGALPGKCTDTAGYISNYEIDTIISSDPSAKILWDETSYSNIMTYDSVQWVAYVSCLFLTSDPTVKCIEEDKRDPVAANNEDDRDLVRECGTNLVINR